MVLDAGRIGMLRLTHFSFASTQSGVTAEFGTPSGLLGKSSGLFRSLVDESRDREELLALIKD